jgi:hypothetical protein
VRLGDDPGGDRRQLHELGVGCLLPAEHDRGNPGGQHRVEAVLPGPAAAKDADDDDVRVLQVAGTSSAVRRAGLPSRYPAPLARADSRSVSEVDSRTITVP